MNKSVTFPLSVLVSLLLSGCSALMPYDDEFGCRPKDGTGKCADMNKAYQQAVAGVSHAQMQLEPNKPAPAPTQNAYGQYVDSYYAEISSMVDKPITPMVKQAKTIRTLILPYPSKEGEIKTLWMERYAYTIVQEPDFVLGQYLTRKSQLLENFLKNADDNKASPPKQSNE